MPTESQRAVETTPQALECGDPAPLSPAADSAAAVPPNLAKSNLQKNPWPHAPVHQLTENGVYFVTAGTWHKEHLFKGSDRLDFLEDRLLRLAAKYHWQIEAWAVFANHYHFVARSRPESKDIGAYISHLHSDTARNLNRMDGKPARKIWHNFWETQLTFDKSYFARLNYVHQNAAKHKLVPVANQYRWCSAAWFERVVAPAMVQTIYSFKTDLVNVEDDF